MTRLALLNTVMADTLHLDPRRLAHFRARVLPTPEMADVARHLGHCTACQQLFQATFARRSTASLYEAFAPARAVQHEHLDAAQRKGYDEGQLTTEEKTILDVHLNACGSCRAELEDYTVWQRALAAEMTTTFGPQPQPATRELGRRGWTHWTAWVRRWLLAPRRAYAGAWAMVLLVLAGVAGAVFWWHKSQPVPLAHHPATLGPAVVGNTPGAPAPTATPPPETSAANSPAQSATPASVPRSRSKSAGHTAPPTVATAPHVPARLPRQTQPPSTPPLISRPVPASPDNGATATPELLALNLTRPAVLQDLASAGGAVRSGNNGATAPAATLTPSGVVVREARPTLRWPPHAGAISYQIVIADAQQRTVLHSDTLPPAVTSWTPPTDLPAGRVLTWAVLVQTAASPVIMPTPSQPEAKFQVLAARQRDALARREKEPRPSLAVAVAYARVGLLAAAERELRDYLAHHPNTPAAQSLLDKVLTW